MGFKDFFSKGPNGRVSAKFAKLFDSVGKVLLSPPRMGVVYLFITSEY